MKGHKKPTIEKYINSRMQWLFKTLRLELCSVYDTKYSIIN